MFTKIIGRAVPAAGAAAYLTVFCWGCGGSGTTVPAPSAGNGASGIVGSETRMIGDSNAPDAQRWAVVYECWYALRQSYLSTPNTTGPAGPTKANWAYITSDANAFSLVSQRSNGNASTQSDFGLNATYPMKGGYGHGGQCPFFAALIIKRARNKDLNGGYWSYKSMTGMPSIFNGNSVITTPQPGDIIFYDDGSHSSGHVAIMVGGSPTTGIDVVDSNYVGVEVIGRHTISTLDLKSKKYQVYSGNGRWYNTSW